MKKRMFSKKEGSLYFPFRWAKKVYSDIGITNIFIVPWENTDRK